MTNENQKLLNTNMKTPTPTDLPLIRIATLLDDVPECGAISLPLTCLPALMALLSPDNELRVVPDITNIVVKSDGNGGAVFRLIDGGETVTGWTMVCFHTGGEGGELRAIPAHPYPLVDLTLTPVGTRGAGIGIRLRPTMDEEIFPCLKLFTGLCQRVVEVMNEIAGEDDE